MTFNIDLARQVALAYSSNNSEKSLIESFSQVCNFLADNPDRISWRSKKNIPSVETQAGLKILAERYFSAYNKSDFPAVPRTVPDEMVSIVMQEAYGYSVEQCEQTKIDHQHSMCAENCVGALLERYLDSVLRDHNWHWCCGDFVKAIDFVSKTDDCKWLALQIKNRDNSENSSSSAIRSGTEIEKWFRSFSKTGKTNWNNLPKLMQGYNLSEQGFVDFVKSYLREQKINQNQ
ncbi:SinI family restriction endonuclease [Pseudanabaena mucicola]|uniref:SinI family restriction endonuclease n=1 Tax=Pseudanabaena mucicola FACHB-723 TaxID=2692860 RepID=A0ABR7ZWK1_9CYAN|nr:SinI family restriction endonuclease [Pseudanabaena mucicola]MBD2188144.1 SinI family restriction endonuclease [Pseudanabaena mucicola FACHB-723]